MEDNLISILETFDVPVFRQGSLTDSDDYPKTFFTFWNTDSPDHAHYNNEEYGTAWSFEVNVYSSDPSTAYLYCEQAITLLKKSGWVIGSRGYDVPSDEETHTGRGFDAFYLQIH